MNLPDKKHSIECTSHIVEDALLSMITKSGAKALPFQLKAATDAAIKLQTQQGILLQAHAGLGKTYIIMLEHRTGLHTCVQTPEPTTCKAQRR